jgi:hypothetical protein
VLPDTMGRPFETLMRSPANESTVAMTDVTPLLNAYRECARLVWNNFLRQRAEPYVDFDALDAFSGICSSLFVELVLRPLGKARFKRANADEPWPFLNVKPISDPFPVMISRPSAHGKYWDHPVTALALKGLSLALIDYFDWDRFGYIDMQYYMVRIILCDEHPDIVGRNALIDVHHARIEAEEPTPNDPADIRSKQS